MDSLDSLSLGVPPASRGKACSSNAPICLRLPSGAVGGGPGDRHPRVPPPTLTWPGPGQRPGPARARRPGSVWGGRRAGGRRAGAKTVRPRCRPARFLPRPQPRAARPEPPPPAAGAALPPASAARRGAPPSASHLRGSRAPGLEAGGPRRSGVPRRPPAPSPHAHGREPAPPEATRAGSRRPPPHSHTSAHTRTPTRRGAASRPPKSQLTHPHTYVPRPPHFPSLHSRSYSGARKTLYLILLRGPRTSNSSHFPAAGETPHTRAHTNTRARTRPPQMLPSTPQTQTQTPTPARSHQGPAAAGGPAPGGERAEPVTQARAPLTCIQRARVRAATATAAAGRLLGLRRRGRRRRRWRRG